jgi:hypothetical protein
MIFVDIQIFIFLNIHIKCLIFSRYINNCWNENCHYKLNLGIYFKNVIYIYIYVYLFINIQISSILPKWSIQFTRRKTMVCNQNDCKWHLLVAKIGCKQKNSSSDSIH